MKKKIFFLFFALYSQIKPETLELFDSFNQIESNYKSLEQEIISEQPLDTTANRSQRIKDWTFIVYIAADNDLRSFAGNNIKQMREIGSSKYLNICVHLDIKVNNQKITKRYFIEKDKLIDVNPGLKAMDSGNPQTLVSCMEWASTYYPARNYALILWNHGTGIIDPKNYKIINPAELFTFNPYTNKYDLDRTNAFLDLFFIVDQDPRGICWDNTSGNYLTNKKLTSALNTICSKVIKKKLAIIGFDACLMSMVEVACMVEPYAEFMVSSQEVELGTGWNYSHILKNIRNRSATKLEVASQIVEAYKKSYERITNDYTQSLLDLSNIRALEKNIHEVANLLLACMKSQKNNSVKRSIKNARNKKMCTHFDEPSYVDLHHVYKNILSQTNNFATSADPVARLRNKLKEGISIIEHVVLANVCGKNLSKARGISIYFPERSIHGSYPLSTFGKNNAWLDFLTYYIIK